MKIAKRNDWCLSQKWTIAFFISHVLGWTVAWLQTIWIVYEIKKLRKKR